MEPTPSHPTRPAYVHTQTGTTLIFTLGFALMGITLGMVSSHLGRFWVFPAIVIALVILLFHSLTVSVDDEVVEIALGNRWIKRAVPLRLVEHASLVKNPSLTGWGLRRTGDTWTYAVGGRDAVELVLKGTDTCIRIGSDDAPALLEAILTRLSHQETAR